MSGTLSGPEQLIIVFEELTDRAVATRSYQTKFMPGLTQTQNYTADVMARGPRFNGNSPYNNQFLDRQGRVRRIERRGGTISLLIAEQAFDNQYGTEADMVGTIHNAIVLASSGKHSVRVIPSKTELPELAHTPGPEWSIGADHLIQDVEFARGIVTVAWEDDGTELLLPPSGSEAIARYEEEHRVLGTLALNQEASLELMQDYEAKYAERYMS